jgi:carboxymethylenebutenolidase
MAAQRRLTRWLGTLLALLIPSFGVLAQDSDAPVETPVPALDVTIATPTPPVRPLDTTAREQFVQFPGESSALGGFMWKPAGDGPFPAVLYNHGSEQLPGRKPDLGQLFVGNGYVVFVPHRRGQGRSPGPYIQDQIAQAPPSERNRIQVEILEAQVADQLAGLEYLRGLPYVDANRLAVAGCSYGGIETLLGAERSPGYRAALDFAGGAQSWAGNPNLRERLLRAVQAINVPISFLQAENDYDTQPSRVLSAEMDRLGRPNTVRIYPPFGTTREEGHGGFCEYGGGVWGADVFAFLKRWLG